MLLTQCFSRSILQVLSGVQFINDKKKFISLEQWHKKKYTLIFEILSATISFVLKISISSLPSMVCMVTSSDSMKLEVLRHISIL